MIFTNTAQNKGSALIAVFWLIAVLGLVVFGAARFVSVDAKWSKSLRSQAQARSLAESGIAIATHPNIREGDPLLSRTMEEGDVGYRVEISTEEGLVPVNQLLLSGRKAILVQLFRSWGLDATSAAALGDAMHDWVDENDLVSLNGAEADAYSAMGMTGLPLNRPFASLSEMDQVRGVTQLSQLRPDWKTAFTIWSDGSMDLNEMRPDIAAAILGIPIEKAKAVFAQRVGQDGKKGTLDDQLFDSVPQAFAAYGFPAGNADGFTINGATRRLIGEGFYYGTTVRVIETRREEGLIWRREF